MQAERVRENLVADTGTFAVTDASSGGYDVSPVGMIAGHRALVAYEAHMKGFPVNN